MSLSCLNNTATTWAQVQDGRLKMWDTTSSSLQQQIRLKNFSQANCISFSQPKSKKTGLVALGGIKGDIMVFSTASSEVVMHITTHDKGHEGTVNDVCFNKDGTKLYSCGDDAFVVGWDINTGKEITRWSAAKLPVTKLCISNDNNKMITCTSDIKLWDISTGTLLNRYHGHTDPVKCLSFTSDDSYFISASSSKYVTIYNVNMKNNNKKIKNIQTILSKDEPQNVNIIKTNKNVYNIIIITQSGILQLFEWKPSSTTAAPIYEQIAGVNTVQETGVSKAIREDSAQNKKRKSRKLESKVDQFVQGKIIECQYTNNNNKIIVVRQSTVRPVFHIIDINELKGKKQITLSKAENITLLNNNNDVIANDNNSIKQKRKVITSVDTVENANPMIIQQLKSNKMQKFSKELSLSELLVAKEKKRKIIQDNNMNDDDDNNNELINAPRSGSLQTILSQALHSNDNELLEYCLNRGGKNNQVIQQTVQRLPSEHVVALLILVIEKLQHKPSRGSQLLVWIQQILLSHTTHLVKTSNLSMTLAPLHQLLESRLNMFQPLLKLSGRLSLLLSQVENDDNDNDNEVAGPLNVINEKDIPLYKDDDDDDDDDESGSDDDDDDDSEDNDNDDMSDD